MGSSAAIAATAAQMGSSAAIAATAAQMGSSAAIAATAAHPYPAEPQNASGHGR
jgi:hypothetical protein